MSATCAELSALNVVNNDFRLQPNGCNDPGFVPHARDLLESFAGRRPARLRRSSTVLAVGKENSVESVRMSTAKMEYGINQRDTGDNE